MIKQLHKWFRGRAGIVTLPVFNMGGFINTIEGGLLHKKVPDSVYKPIRDAFYALPGDVQHSMMFSSKRGEWLARAHWWRKLVYSALPQKQAAEVMQRLCAWYRHCVDIGRKLGEEAAV